MKWRHQWRSIPQLVFDNGFARLNRLCRSDSTLMRSKLIMLNIYKALLAHEGPITKFVLSILGLESNDEIDLIVHYLSDKGVQDLTLRLYCRDGKVGGYQMHSSLFYAHHLTSLELCRCKFSPPSWFLGFNKLTHLRVGYVMLPRDFFENFLTKCPMLEYLSVLDCQGYAAELEIVAPFLKSFNFGGSLEHISFKGTPLLSFVTLKVYGPNTQEMVPFFASVPTLQQFCTNAQFLRNLAAGNRNVPTALPSSLHRLEVLEIIHLESDSLEQEHAFVCLIMSSPNLRRLKVQMACQRPYYPPTNNEVRSIQKLLEAEDSPGFSDCFQHLEVFRIEESCGTQVELDLVRFVLATAPRLQRIHITPTSKLSSERVLKFTVEAMRYKRASPEAEFIYDLIDKDIREQEGLWLWADDC